MRKIKLAKEQMMRPEFIELGDIEEFEVNPNVELDFDQGQPLKNWLSEFNYLDNPDY